MGTSQSVYEYTNVVIRRLLPLNTRTESRLISFVGQTIHCTIPQNHLYNVIMKITYRLVFQVKCHWKISYIMEKLGFTTNNITISVTGHARGVTATTRCCFAIFRSYSFGLGTKRFFVCKKIDRRKRTSRERHNETKYIIDETLHLLAICNGAHLLFSQHWNKKTR